MIKDIAIIGLIGYVIYKQRKIEKELTDIQSKYDLMCDDDDERWCLYDYLVNTDADVDFIKKLLVPPPYSI